MAEERRRQRYAELVKEELGKILFDFLDVPPGILVTVTRVDVSGDLFHAAVMISIFPSGREEEIFGRIQKSIYRIQQLFNKKMRIRPVPQLRFVLDRNPEEAGKVEELIRDTKEKNDEQ